MKISEALRKLLENPDDLSTLPQLVSKVEELETQVEKFPEIEQQYHERINRLQEINRSYLAQIPIPGEETKPQEQEQEVTFDDAKEQLLNAMKKVGGYNND